MVNLDQCDKLIASSGAAVDKIKGEYTAPSTVPTTNPDVVTCEITKSQISDDQGVVYNYPSTLTNPSINVDVSEGVSGLQTACTTAGGVYESEALPKEEGCWFVALSATQNCNDICTQKSLTCSADSNWTVTTAVCSDLGQILSLSVHDSEYSPISYYDSGKNYCKNDTDNLRDCIKPGLGPYKRICKCTNTP